MRCACAVLRLKSLFAVVVLALMELCRSHARRGAATRSHRAVPSRCTVACSLAAQPIGLRARRRRRQRRPRWWWRRRAQTARPEIGVPQARYVTSVCLVGEQGALIHSLSGPVCSAAVAVALQLCGFKVAMSWLLMLPSLCVCPSTIVRFAFLSRSRRGLESQISRRRMLACAPSGNGAKKKWASLCAVQCQPPGALL